MTNKETVQLIQRGFIAEIKRILEENKIEAIQFKTPFRIWVTEDFYDDESRIPYSVGGLSSDGTLFGVPGIDEDEFPLETLDLYEISHILDLLEDSEYTIINETTDESEELTPHIQYYNNGNVWIKGQKNSKGQREGIWERFYPNGNIYRRTPYKEGKRDGIDEWFDEQGYITETYLWKNGKLIEETEN